MVNHAKHQNITNPEYPMITHKDAKSVLINKMAEMVRSLAYQYYHQLLMKETQNP